jgi:stress-induced morphogen
LIGWRKSDRLLRNPGTVIAEIVSKVFQGESALKNQRVIDIRLIE